MSPYVCEIHRTLKKERRKFLERQRITKRCHKLMLKIGGKMTFFFAARRQKRAKTYCALLLISVRKSSKLKLIHEIAA